MQVRRVDDCDSLDDLIRHCFPAFGGAFLRRIYTILDQAIGSGCPLTLAISGPVTVSGQHQSWLIPLLETGWIAYLSTTDAVCYHDGHRSLNAHRDPIFEVPIWGADGAVGARRRAIDASSGASSMLRLVPLIKTIAPACVRGSTG